MKACPLEILLDHVRAKALMSGGGTENRINEEGETFSGEKRILLNLGEDFVDMVVVDLGDGTVAASRQNGMEQ